MKTIKCPNGHQLTVSDVSNNISIGGHTSHHKAWTGSARFKIKNEKKVFEGGVKIKLTIYLRCPKCSNEQNDNIFIDDLPQRMIYYEIPIEDLIEDIEDSWTKMD